MNKILVSTLAILVIISSYFLYKQVTNNMEKEVTIEILTEGTGEPAKAKDKITVHYTGWLEDGTKFDSSVDRGPAFIFTLGIGQVIQGWDEGILGAKVGEKRKLTIPSALAYGETGMGSIIPPNSILIFEVEIINIQ